MWTINCGTVFSGFVWVYVFCCFDLFFVCFFVFIFVSFLYVFSFLYMFVFALERFLRALPFFCLRVLMSFPFQGINKFPFECVYDYRFQLFMCHFEVFMKFDVVAACTDESGLVVNRLLVKDLILVVVLGGHLDANGIGCA